MCQKKNPSLRCYLNATSCGLALFVLGIFLTACGSGGGQTSPSSSNSENRTGTIQGIVTAISGVSFKTGVKRQAALEGTAGIPGAVCTLEGTDKSAVTDQNGFFQIADIPVGSYILICRKTATDGNVYAFLKVVEVQNGQTVDLATTEIIQTGNIQGRAILAGQTDHTGITVFIPGTSMQAKTDATGAYLMGNIPQGTYELRFEKSGYATDQLVGISVTSGQTTTLGDLILNLSTGATGSLTIENGSAYSASRTVAVSITASADATLMQISEDSSFIGGTWIPVSSTTTWTFASDGEKRLYIKFADANGLESAPVSDDIIVDAVPPTNESIAINMGTPTTNSASVTLTLSATDATTSISQMMISNASDFSDAVWETFNGTRSWTLPSGDGTKTIYVKFKDIVGNETTTAVSASILLDTQSPTNAGGSIQEGAYTNNHLIHLSLTASNAVFMKISEDLNFTGVSSSLYAATSTFTLSSGDGNKTVYVRYLDDAGNIVDFTLNPIVVDTTLPTTPVIFNRNQTTNQTTFTMTLATASTDANFKTYQLKGGQYADWTDTAETGLFSLTLSQQGANTLSIRGKDQAGNVGSAASIVVTLDTTSSVLSNISVSAMGTSATIQWSTNESTTGAVEYGLNTNYGSSQSDSNVTTSHTVTITGLSELTTYSYRISATDYGNNTTTSTNLTFKTGHEVSGNITSNTTWTTTQSPYIVVGNIGVIAGVTLMIEPGVTVEFAGPYTILVKGSVVANGTHANKIVFKSQIPGTSSGATVLKFAETNLSNSQLSYLTIEDAYEAIRVGNESEFVQTNPKNSGTLNATYTEVTRAGITADGYQTTAKVVLTNATIVNSSVLGTYPRSEPIEISYSTITNSSVTSDSYNYGITISNTTSSGSNFYIGCCGANMIFLNSMVLTGSISEGGGQPIAGPIQITKSQFTNFAVALPSAAVTITDSTFTYDSSYVAPSSSYGSSNPDLRIKLGNGSLTNSRVTGNGGGVGLEITGYAGYSNSGQSFSVSNSDVTGNATGILCSGNFLLPVSTSNIYNNSTYDVDYRNIQNSTATGNYWGVTTASEVNALIYDGNDDINYGILGVSTFSTTPIAGTGPQP